MQTKRISPIIFSLLILLILLFTVACSKKECTTNSDCANKAFNTVTCTTENICKYEAMTNVCGNLKCEAKENNCNCAADCKPKCDGKISLGKKGSTELFTKYIEQGCIGEKKASVCQIQIIDQFATPQTVVDEKKVGDIKLGISSTYAKAIDPQQIPFKVNLELKDSPSTVILPVKITTISILSGQTLLGKKTVNQELATVGDAIAITIPFTFTPSLQEEEKQVSVKIELEYTKKSANSQDLQRISTEEKIADKIAFVKTGIIEK